MGVRNKGKSWALFYNEETTDLESREPEPQFPALRADQGQSGRKVGHREEQDTRENSAEEKLQVTGEVDERLESQKLAAEVEESEHGT